MLGGQPQLLTDIGPPCASWCTMQLRGAQRRSVVHNVVLYPRDGVQGSSQTPNVLFLCYDLGDLMLITIIMSTTRNNSNLFFE